MKQGAIRGFTWLPVSSVCDATQPLMEMSLPGEFLRGDDANGVCKTSAVEAKMIIGTEHIVFLFMLAPVLYSSWAAHRAGGVVFTLLL